MVLGIQVVGQGVTSLCFKLSRIQGHRKGGLQEDGIRRSESRYVLRDDGEEDLEMTSLQKLRSSTVKKARAGGEGCPSRAALRVGQCGRKPREHFVKNVGVACETGDLGSGFVPHGYDN